MPSARDAEGREVAAVRGVIASVLGMINAGNTYVGMATDHVIESFRNDLWHGYKTGAGIDPALLGQFGLLEEAIAALGVAVWPMVEFEADDALAAAAAIAAEDPRVDRVVICTPDKDLAQCVRGTRVVQMNRRTRSIRDEAGVVEKFGVLPESIPDDWQTWRVNASQAGALARTLARERDRAFLFRDLATLRTGIPLFESVDELRWTGPTPAFAALAGQLDAAVVDEKARGRKPREAG